MKPELELKLQSYLDGELSSGEARDVAAAINSDPEAQALVRELKTTAAVLRENEPQMAVPESREFYWSKIERAIERCEPEPARPMLALWYSLRRVIAPVAGVALVLFLGIASFKFQGGSSDTSSAYLAEVESLSEHVSSFSFRSQSQNMFVVWLHENNDQQQASIDTDSDFDDEILQ